MLSSILVLYITCSKNKVTSWKKEQKECKSWCGLRRYGEKKYALDIAIAFPNSL